MEVDQFLPLPACADIKQDTLHPHHFSMFVEQRNGVVEHGDDPAILTLELMLIIGEDLAAQQLPVGGQYRLWIGVHIRNAHPQQFFPGVT